jgi:hypothetical protein
MKLIISKRHINGQLKKFGFREAEEGVYDIINKYHLGLVKNVASKKQSLQGGRVAMPLEYFGGETSSYTSSPNFTDISSTNSWVRPTLPLNDPSGFLGTQKALDPFVGGGAPCFQVPKSSCKEALSHLDIEHSKNLVEKTKLKFETLMTKVLNKVSKSSKSSSVLKQSELKSVLNQQSYKKFKL